MFALLCADPLLVSSQLAELSATRTCVEVFLNRNSARVLSAQVVTGLCKIRYIRNAFTWNNHPRACCASLNALVNTNYMASHDCFFPSLSLLRLACARCCGLRSLIPLLVLLAAWDSNRLRPIRGIAHPNTAVHCLTDLRLQVADMRLGLHGHCGAFSRVPQVQPDLAVRPHAIQRAHGPFCSPRLLESARIGAASLAACPARIVLLIRVAAACWRSASISMLPSLSLRRGVRYLLTTADS